MEHFGTLIASYAATGISDESVVESWCAAHPMSVDGWIGLAEYIGAAFLDHRITYEVANGLMNELMPIAGWNAAPKRFWEYYIAFEDGEVLEEPDEFVRKAVMAVAKGAA